MTKTFQIAYLNDTAMLIAICPDGADIEAATRAVEVADGTSFDRDEITIEAGLTEVTEDQMFEYPDDQVVWRGSPSYVRVAV